MMGGRRGDKEGRRDGDKRGQEETGKDAAGRDRKRREVMP